MKKTLIIAVMVLVSFCWAMICQAEDMVIKSEKSGKTSYGQVLYTSGTMTLSLTDPASGEVVKYKDAYFVEVRVIVEDNNKIVLCQSMYMAYMINDKNVEAIRNKCQMPNVPVPFKGQSITPKMRKGNITLARERLRNEKQELFNLCVLYQAYKAVKEEESVPAQSIAQDIKRGIKEIREKYGEEALDAESVLVCAGLK